MRLARKKLITMRFSHFLGNVIGYVLYFFFIRNLKNFCSSGLFQKTKHGEEGRHLFSLSLSKAYWLNYTL